MFKKSSYLFAFVLLLGLFSVSSLATDYYIDPVSGSDTSGLKPKGVIHWVDAGSAVPVTVKRYQRLFTEAQPDLDDVDAALNPHSVLTTAGFVEAAIAGSESRTFQFERQGYFCRDGADPGLYHRTVTLRDSYKPGS